MRKLSLVAVLSIVLPAWFSLAALAADENAPPGEFQFSPPPGLEGLGNLGGGDLFSGGGQEVTFTASFTAPADGPVQLHIGAKLAKGWHLYSVTQPKGGPQRTKITLEEDPRYELAGEFKPNRAPKVHPPDVFDVPSEEHSDSVTWTAPVRLSEGVDPQTLTIRGTVRGQVCQTGGSCVPVTEEFAASYADTPAAASPLDVPDGIGEYIDPQRSFATIRGQIEPEVAKPGDEVRLYLSIEPQAGWHTYRLAAAAPTGIGNRPTLIMLTETSGLSAAAPISDKQPVESDSQQPDGSPGLAYYEGPVTWQVTLTVPKEMAAGEYPIAGLLGYQVCEGKERCDSPRAVRFEGKLKIGDTDSGAATPLAFYKSNYNDVADTLSEAALEAVPPVKAINWSLLPFMIVSSLIGGLLLNLMPCVLPVIGLKILSFVEQGGQSYGRVLLLNIAYSAGLILVFLVLATLAVTLQIGWGQQFSSTAFNVAMCGLVFVMALSFLGVWEIPLPGFVGSGKAGALAAKEGISGAFFKGIFTTLLATPCSGPFLGPVFGGLLKQPPVVTYLVFTCIGLGMSAPYLLIGAYPRLIRYLPRPGAWMDTFKQLMAFVLLGTVVFIFSFMNSDYVVPTFSLLVALWFACWLIGRTPITASSRQKWTSWIEGALAVAVVGWFSFSVLVPHEEELPWQPYSPQLLATAQADGKTVLVDFTADWCLTCKTNLKFSINTNKVGELVAANDVVPMLADWTDGSSEIKRALEELDSNSIPVLAIYPAGRPEDVIILRDLITQGQVLAALEQAGPSKRKEPTETANSAATAMK